MAVFHKRELEENIRMVIAGANGISLKTAQFFPSFLERDEVGGECILCFKDLILDYDKEFEGVPTYVITASWIGRLSQIWPGKEDFLVRQILERRQRVVFRNIKLNKKLAEAVFNLDPKTGK